MTMSFLLIVVLASLAEAQIIFGPVRSQPGESIRLLSHSETPGGTITQTALCGTTQGSMAITRERDLVWTFGSAADDGSRRGMVRVNALSTSTTSVIAGKEDLVTETSPLTGKMFAMTATQGTQLMLPVNLRVTKSFVSEP